MEELDKLLEDLGVVASTGAKKDAFSEKLSRTRAQRPSTDEALRMSRYKTPASESGAKSAYLEELPSEYRQESSLSAWKSTSRAGLDDIFDMLEPSVLASDSAVSGPGSPGADGGANAYSDKGTKNLDIDDQLNDMLKDLELSSAKTADDGEPQVPQKPKISSQEAFNKHAGTQFERGNLNNNNGPKNGAYQKWSIRQVADWLATLGVSESVIASFIENEIDGSSLDDLNKETLKDDLHITALGPRTKILKGIQALQASHDGQGSPTPASSGPIPVTDASFDRNVSPICSGCNFPITSGMNYKCAGKDWHEQCFACIICYKRLSPDSFFEHRDNPYCEQHFSEVSSARCAYCNGHIEGECIFAMDKNWHVDHFFCSHCGASIDEEFSEQDGLAYCSGCYTDLYAAKCLVCKKAITDSVLSIAEGSYHDSCFTCTKCQVSVADQYWVHKGKLYCKKHAAEAKGEICYDCNKIIVGKSIKANNRSFHTDHFYCRYCRKNLVKDTKFQEKFDQFYCISCYIKLYE